MSTTGRNNLTHAQVIKLGQWLSENKTRLNAKPIQLNRIAALATKETGVTFRERQVSTACRELGIKWKPYQPVNNLQFNMGKSRMKLFVKEKILRVQEVIHALDATFAVSEELTDMADMLAETSTTEEGTNGA